MYGILDKNNLNNNSPSEVDKLLHWCNYNRIEIADKSFHIAIGNTLDSDLSRISDDHVRELTFAPDSGFLHEAADFIPPTYPKLEMLNLSIDGTVDGSVYSKLIEWYRDSIKHIQINIYNDEINPETVLSIVRIVLSTILQNQPQMDLLSVCFNLHTNPIWCADMNSTEEIDQRQVEVIKEMLSSANPKIKTNLR